MTKKIAIACQGGGSHTAFTAGALKTLLRQLDPERHRIIGLSGTSGGALCAVFAWYGLLLHDADKAATLLDAFWADIAATASWDLALNDTLVWLDRLRESIILPEMSPYQLPPYAQQRVAQALNKHLPFAQLDALLAPDSPALLVGAVNVLSGEFTVFRSDHPDPAKRITVQALLASAAVPTLFRAVHIGKEVYWDGLFSENPPIQGFLAQKKAVDRKPDEIWVIQINPETRSHEPKSVKEIEDRRNELAGNLSLNQEIGFVQQVNDWMRRGWLSAAHFKQIELRWIPLTLDLDHASKLDRSPPFIRMLMQHGEAAATTFLAQLP